MKKDISTCVLSNDPECAFTWGEVRTQESSLQELAHMLYINHACFFKYHQMVASLKYVYFSSARRSSYCISLRAGAILSNCELVIDCTPVLKLCLKYCKLVVESIAKVGNRAALTLAKKNIEGFYPVVGVLEKLGL